MVQTSTFSIQHYEGQWTQNEVIHLLKRTMFGAKPSDIAYFSKLTLSDAVDQLLQAAPAPTPPLNNYNTTDYQDPMGIKLGETWVNSLYGDGTVNAKRRTSYKSWWIAQMLNQTKSIHEKMILFWHNHFATEIDTVNDARFCYRYHTILRKYALGNFKSFVKEITLDPAMLKYLNGDKNTKTAPDENYGRELQELFTIGKGSGSKYTEDDVKAAAKVLTGYKTDGIKIAYTFTANLHDTTDKKFSSFYNSTTIKGKTGAEGEKELDELLAMIFGVNEVSKFICRKLFTFFVHYDLNDDIEKNVIEPLSKIFRDNNYEILPVLKTLFKSQYFFDEKYRGAMIKSPLDFLIGSLRQFSVSIPSISTALVENYYFNIVIATQAKNLQQDIGDPPNVAGWAAYYQSPSFYELWINSDTFPKRVAFTDTMITKGYTRNSQRMEVNVFDFAKALSTPNNPNSLLDESLAIFHQISISDTVKAQIKKDILLGGQSTDYYWTEIWDNAIKNPTDKAAQTMVLNKLKSLYQYLLALPEYQLM